MKYTLFAFHVFHAEFQDQVGGASELARVIDQTASHRAEIALGVYVFETEKGWRDMHRLRSLLVRSEKEYVELPFEEKLAGFFSPSVASKLRELGKSNGQELSLLNLNQKTNH